MIITTGPYPELGVFGPHSDLIIIKTDFREAQYIIKGKLTIRPGLARTVLVF